MVDQIAYFDLIVFIPAVIARFNEVLDVILYPSEKKFIANVKQAFCKESNCTFYDYSVDGL